MSLYLQKFFARTNNCKGFALVLVLAFVVLLTGIALAFLSNSLLQRQVSNSSANIAAASLLADGAVDTTIGDLKKEIEDGSTKVSVVTGGVTSDVYAPKSSTGGAYANNVGAFTTMLPCTQGFSRPGTAGTTNGLENLVKVSTNAPFYQGGAYAGAGPTRAATSPTTSGSRPISLARWNKPLFLAATSTSDLTPSATGFPTPNWIYVSSNGGNPQAPDASVVGRYAYAIYDEGGLLDVNVAGYPSSMAPTTTTPDVTYKSAEAYADLTQIGLTQTQIDQIVNWRNQATLSTPNGYKNYVASNSTGFLAVGSSTLSGGVSDQMFVGRQQFIDFLTNKIATNSGGKKAIMDDLQYFTTFSRDLAEPSFIRLHAATTSGGSGTTVSPSTWDVNSQIPKVQAATSGGNNATGLDSEINPSFLSIRAQSTFTRNNGSTAVVGDPLVRRFALNRLAWITCEGPSADRNTSDLDIQALINDGISASYLALGTGDNIQRYFGLSWDKTNHCWIYNVHNVSGPILKLWQVASATPGREPDFFELLKAAVNVGSIAKTLTAPGQGDSAAQAQYSHDLSVDYAIIQMGANIIDQFDTDGFPTRIQFNDGTGMREFAGVENLPYIYRIRNGLIKVAAPKLTGSSGAGYTTSWSGDANQISDTGVGALIQFVDLWNPHDYSTINLNQTQGAQGPTDFRVYATSTLGSLVITAKGGNPPGPLYSGGISSTDQSQSPGYQTMYGFPWAGESRTLNVNNTQMTFTIPKTSTGATLFREPTILFQPGKPTGSNLASPSIAGKSSALGTISNDVSFFAGGGLKSAVASDDGTGLPALNAGYIGFYFGCEPLQYMYNGQRYAGQQSEIGGTPMVTYTLQCKDAFGAWVTYDEKFAMWSGGVNDTLMSNASSQFLLQFRAGPNYGVVVDPRTSRFGLMTGWSVAQAYFIPPFHPQFVNDPQRTGFISKSEGIVLTQRDGYCGGALAASFGGGPAWTPKTTMGWYPGGYDMPSNGSEPLFRISTLEQNDPNYRPERALSDQTGWGGDGVPPRSASTGITQALYYSDPDNVVRRGAGAYNTQSNFCTNNPNLAATYSGSPAYLPLATANDLVTGTTLVRNEESSSRPIILNRPFHSVGELGYVFSGTPWKNINFFLPESGETALLDVFCINDSNDAHGLIAGKVNLNTRQATVLEAILNGAYKDEWYASGNSLHPSLTTALAGQVAQLLMTRTASSTGNLGPLVNIGDIVGKFESPQTVATSAPNGNSPSNALYGAASNDGFAKDLTSVLPFGVDTQIQRFREASLRGLVASGQTRVWNLMIDVIAQTGKFPSGGTSFARFSIGGERRLWVHLAIDRFTGRVLDKQVEVVTE